MSKYPESEYDNTHNMSTRQQNEAKYPKYEYRNTRNTSMAGKLIRVQAEQIRETPGANCRHSAWIEDARKYTARKYGIRGDADGQHRREDSK